MAFKFDLFSVKKQELKRSSLYVPVLATAGNLIKDKDVGRKDARDGKVVLGVQ